jgi:hypothetical protein
MISLMTMRFSGVVARAHGRADRDAHTGGRAEIAVEAAAGQLADVEPVVRRDRAAVDHDEHVLALGQRRGRADGRLEWRGAGQLVPVAAGVEQRDRDVAVGRRERKGAIVRRGPLVHHIVARGRARGLDVVAAVVGGAQRDALAQLARELDVDARRRVDGELGDAQDVGPAGAVVAGHDDGELLPRGGVEHRTRLLAARGIVVARALESAAVGVEHRQRRVVARAGEIRDPTPGVGRGPSIDHVLAVAAGHRDVASRGRRRAARQRGADGLTQLLVDTARLHPTTVLRAPAALRAPSRRSIVAVIAIASAGTQHQIHQRRAHACAPNRNPRHRQPPSTRAIRSRSAAIDGTTTEPLQPPGLAGGPCMRGRTNPRRGPNRGRGCGD